MGFMHKETPMSRTGLSLTPVPCSLGVGNLIFSVILLLASYTRRKIAILDVIRPSDIWRERLRTAHQDKLRIYEPLYRALSNYADSKSQTGKYEYYNG